MNQIEYTSYKWLEKGYQLSPTWDNTPNFDIGEGDAEAVNAINTLKNSGSASFNLISVGETNDVEALMRAANDAGMVGKGYVWGGFDVFGATVNSNSDAVISYF